MQRLQVYKYELMPNGEQVRSMSPKVKFCNNWKRALARVLKIRTGVAHARKDFLHIITTTTSQNHAILCAEDWQVRNMPKSSTGNSEQHAKRVKQKSALNRTIADRGLGQVSNIIWPTQATFLCITCGYENHAGPVDAINLLARGHRLSAATKRFRQTARRSKNPPKRLANHREAP